MNDFQNDISAIERILVRTISPRDEMFNFARTRLPDDAATAKYYFETGRELATGLLAYLHGQGLKPSELDLLDFAAGYGRVTRWFGPAFRSVTMADLDADMVAFQRENFGISGFVSGIEPTSISPHKKLYDVVFVFSMFTHLPSSTWRSWLLALMDKVRVGGHFVFSTHSYDLFALLDPGQYGDKSKWKEEFVFWEVNETNGRLDTKSYGCNIIKESYVRKIVSEISGVDVARHYGIGDFDRYHDIFVLRKAESP